MKKLLAVILLSISSITHSFTGNEYCLAQNIWHEARGEATEDNLEPWLAVAFVTLNRAKSWRWPMTVCGVVWDDSQFSWTNDALPDEILPKDDTEALLWEEILYFSKTFLENWRYIEDPTGGSDHYYAVTISPPTWVAQMEYKNQIGKHRFYLDKR